MNLTRALSYVQDRAVYPRHGLRSNSQKANCEAERAFLEECGSGDARVNQHCQEVYQKGKLESLNFPTSPFPVLLHASHGTCTVQECLSALSLARVVLFV